MKTETKKRIKAYQKALPHMKERVMAVAMLLVLSVTMMTSATFAWITLSRSPEVTGLATTIATNGNLEIALSGIEGNRPEESQVGDGGKGVRLSNLTWGNLINLSDPSYGLEAVTLRPAVLNSGSLDVSPLYSVEYGADGRVTGTISDFLFTNYGTKDGISAFYVPDDGNTDYGVRAISSVTYSTEGEEQLVDQMNKAATRSYIAARSAFANLYGNKEYMSSITQLAGVYLSYRIFDSDQDCGGYIEDIYYMAEEFHNTMEAVKLNLLDVANLQHYVYCNQNNQNYTAFKEEDLLNGTMATTLRAEGITMDALTAYMSMRSKFYGDGTNGAYYKLKAIYDEWDRIGDYVGWEELAGVGSVGGPVNVMADIPSTTVNGTPASGISSSNIGDVTGYDPNVCVVQKGLIKDMDQLLGTQLSVKVDKISVLFVSVENVVVSTSAASPWTLAEDNNAARDAASADLVAKNATAADTYGMAIDFWVRTNSRNSRLILEGEYVKETVVLKDAAGNDILDDNGKPVTEERVVGYQGVNRVWEGDDPDLPEQLGLGTSATQGSGSCYVFYVENPEDQQQSLEMLKSMRVAFADANGDLLAIADMDTENVFEDGGRVLVPLLVRGRTVTVQQEKKDADGNIIYQTDENDNPILDAQGNPVPEMEEVEKVSHHITDLTQNQPQRITAIMYLDGEKLENSQVLAAGSIKGQLNIQFGTSEDLVSVNDPDLKKEYYNITVDVTQASGDFTKYDPNNKPVVDVTLALNGMDASTIRGNFISMVSTTQGAKQDPFTFTHVDGTATWTARVTLTGAGTYQLRSVQIDGVDYQLTAQQIKDTQIVIPGTTVYNVQCTDWNESDKFSYMSADTYYDLEVTADISGTSPRSVKGVFENKDRQNVTINFAPDGTTRWKGEGTFTTSGEYVMTYMIIDNVRVPLLGVDYKTLNLQLGMKTRVFMTQPVNEEYKELKPVYDKVEAVLKAENTRAAVALTAEEKALAAEVIAASEDLTAEAKTALTEAVNSDNMTVEQLETLADVLEDKLADILDELYNGDPNDPDDGIQLNTTADGYSFFFNGGTGNELYVDLSCIITDDKDHPLTGLDDVKLEYQLGTSLTGLDDNLTWNGETGYYEGEFQIAVPGRYTFRQLLVGENRITSAISAPFIAANSRDPMEYAGPGVDNVTYDGEIRANAKREMTVVLKNAPSATVKMIMEYTDVDKDGKSLQETHELIADLSYSDNVNKLYEYTVSLPKDGTWKVVGMKVANVVYYDENRNKVYFDGATDAGWVDLSAEVLADNIVTEFFTTVIYSVNTQPASFYDGEFMEDHKVNNMAVTLTDYLGRPVEGASVTLKYAWDRVSATEYFAVQENVQYPNSLFEATKQSDGITFAMPAEMNFQLPGQYNVTFDMKIGETTYKFSDFTKAKDSVELTTQNPVNVSWTLPDVKITAVTDATKDSKNNKTFTVNLAGDDEQTGILTKRNTPQSGVQNYFEDYYANVYIMGELDDYSAPSLSVKLNYAGETGTASLNVGGTTFSFAESGVTSTKDIGSVSGNNRRRVGTTTAERIALTYGDMSFNVNLRKKITIRQDDNPLYIDFVVNDSEYVTYGGTVPARVISPDGRTVKLPDELRKTYRISVDTNPNATYAATGTTSEDKQYYYVEAGYKTDYITYDLVGTQMKKTSTFQYHQVTKKISEWTINGQTYAYNAEVPLSVSLKATAVVELVSKVEDGTSQTDMYYWSYYYRKGKTYNFLNGGLSGPVATMNKAGYVTEITNEERSRTWNSAPSENPDDPKAR